VMLVGNRVPPNLRNSLDHHGFEWKEISVSELIAYLKSRNDVDLLAQLDEEVEGSFKMPLQEIKDKVVKKIKEHRRTKQEELIEVAEDYVEKFSEEPPDVVPKTITRLEYELLITNPYKFTEREFFYEVHVVHRKRADLKIETYQIKRSPLVKSFGWGIHRNQEGKLALVPLESDRYKELQESIKRTKSYCKNKPTEAEYFKKAKMSDMRYKEEDMIEIPPSVRILPMDAKGEFNGRSTEDVQQNFFLVELPSRTNCKYPYHKAGLKAPPGTIVLFQYDSRLIASAHLIRTEKFEKPEDVYDGALYFDAKSITIFDPIDAEAVFLIWSEFKGFARTKWSLNPDRFPLFVTELSGVKIVNVKEREP